MNPNPPASRGCLAVPGGRSYRILYHHRTQDADGQRVHIREMQRALADAGHEVLEVAPVRARHPAGSQAPAGARHERMLRALARRAPAGLYECLEWGYNVPGYLALAAAIRRFHPDFIYERYALNTLAGIWASRRFGVPLLLEVNSPLADERRHQGRLRFHRLSRRLEVKAIRGARVVLAVTGVLRDRLAAESGLEPGEIPVVQNGARLARFDRAIEARDAVRRQLGVEHRVVAGSVAFFLPWHGLDRLVEAVARQPVLRDRLHLLLVGDGPALPALRQAVSAHGLSATFTGPVAHDEVPELVAALDIAVIPRAIDYASPLKLFEYMAAARAVVAPRQANLCEVVTDGTDALCFEPEEVEGLTAAVHRLTIDPPLRDRIGASARDTLERRDLTWAGNARRVVEIYERRCTQRGIVEVGAAAAERAS